MAKRPWVLPKDVVAYTEIEAVQKRSKARLEVDIARAEQYVIAYTRNRFEGCNRIPDPVKTAVILLAEAYASYSYQLKKTGGGTIKSETFDDYSFTLGDGTFDDMVKALDLAALLDEFVLAKASGNITMRMRRL